MAASNMTGTIAETAKVVIEVHGLRFNALVQGPPTGDLVLFLHGFPEFADSWAKIMAPVARAGFRAVAVDQRGYSPGARPENVENYSVNYLLSDIAGFADALGATRFHLVGHDWGALLAWKFAAADPGRIKSLTALSTPHPDALFQAMTSDDDQKTRSQYIHFFRMGGGAAEAFFQANDCERLRSVYQGKVRGALVEENVRRLSESGALTAALNWYRALQIGPPTGIISVPTLYIWSTDDLALGQTAALHTAAYVTAPYRFEKLEGKSHWLLSEAAAEISHLLLEHLTCYSAEL